MRCTRRRNEATERSRTSSVESAVTSVRRPRDFCTPGRAGFGAGAGRAAPAPLPRRGRGASSSSTSGLIERTSIGVFGFVSSSPKRFLASCSARRLVSSSCLRRSSAARFLFGNLALLGLTHLGIIERVRASVALLVGERAQDDAGCLWRGGGRPR